MISWANATCWALVRQCCPGADDGERPPRSVAAEAGVDPHLVTPHRLRHYFGLTSAMAGVPTAALMRALGHRTLIMTARYSEFADAERRWAFARADIANGLRLPTTNSAASPR